MRKAKIIQQGNIFYVYERLWVFGFIPFWSVPSIHQSLEQAKQMVKFINTPKITINEE